MTFSNPAAGAQHAAEAYTAALLDLLGDLDPLGVLAQTVPRLSDAVAGLSDQLIRRPEAPGKWSIVEVVQHLADTELVTGFRLRMVLAHDTPDLGGFDQDRWADRLSYRDAKVRDALAQLTVLRDANVRLIGSLDEHQLRRTGRHAERGPESVHRMIQLLAAHDLVHLRQIERIKRVLPASHS